jgi:ABC-2 family transporter protein
MTTLALNPQTAAAEQHVRFRQLLKAEWIKLRSLRSVVLGLVLASLGVLYCNVNAAIADRALVPHGVVVLNDMFSNNAHIVVLYVFGSLGAIVIVSEHSSGLIRTTFAAVPDRTPVIAAKAIVVAAVTAVAGVVAVAASYVALLILAGHAMPLPLRGSDFRLYLAASWRSSRSAPWLALGTASSRRQRDRRTHPDQQQRSGAYTDRYEPDISAPNWSKPAFS